MTDSSGFGEQNAFAALRQRAREAARQVEEQCDLCGAPIGPEHRHLLDAGTRELQCLCDACRILFSNAAAGGGNRRLVPVRYLDLSDFQLTDAEWESLRVPVNMAFFLYNSAEGRVTALYPSPMGATESLLTLESWQELAQRNAILQEMEPDVEALLVNRSRGASEYFLVPIDECYKLVGIIRVYWKGFTGGQQVWQEVAAFFVHLRAKAGSGGGAHA